MEQINLENKLREAHEAWTAQRKLPWDVEALHRCMDGIHAAEAALSKHKQESYAIPVDLGISICFKGARLLQSDSHCFLAVMIREDASVWSFALIAFENCSWTTFGYPNDEALPGHPLHGKGLDSRHVCEVFNSEWFQRMQKQNRICFPEYAMPPLRHFILCFHDSTFECLAGAATVVHRDSSMDRVVAHALSLMGSN